MQAAGVATSIQPDLLTPLNAAQDPRVAAAVADFRGAVVEVRRLSAQLFPLPTSSPHREPLQEAIDDLTGGMQARADTVGITLDELFALINADLRTQRSGHTHAPQGDYLRALLDDNTRAYADEKTIKREIGRLEQLLPSAAERRVATDQACAGYVAGWAVRGDAR